MKEIKVLLINQQSINSKNATGITMRSLFAEQKTENIMEVRFESKHEQLTDDGALNVVSLSLPMRFIKKIASLPMGSKVNDQIKRSAVSAGGKLSHKARVRQSLVLALETITPKLQKKQMDLIKEFRPNVIYTLGSSVSVLKIAYRVSKKIEVPLLIHFMDNWAEYIQWEECCYAKAYKLKLGAWLKKCLTRTRCILTISASMAKAYEKFGLPCDALMNSIDLSRFCKGACENKAYRDPIRLTYAGGLHLNRWEALRSIAATIKENGIPMVLHIYTNEKDAELYKNEFCDLPTEFFGAVSHEKILEVYDGADVLVHVETESPMLLGFFKYSISTKIPEYLATGKPVMFFGPKQLGLYEYLSENNAAYVASNKDELLKELKRILFREGQEEILTNAVNLARKNHSVTAARKVLAKALEDSI